MSSHSFLFFTTCIHTQKWQSNYYVQTQLFLVLWSLSKSLYQVLFYPAVHGAHLICVVFIQAEFSLTCLLYLIIIVLHNNECTCTSDQIFPNNLKPPLALVWYSIIFVIPFLYNVSEPQCEHKCFVYESHRLLHFYNLTKHALLVFWSRRSPCILSHSPNLPMKSYNSRNVFIMPTCSYCLALINFFNCLFRSFMAAWSTFLFIQCHIIMTWTVSSAIGHVFLSISNFLLIVKQLFYFFP